MRPQWAVNLILFGGLCVIASVTGLVMLNVAA